MKEILISTRELVNNNPPDWIDAPTLTEKEFVELVAYTICSNDFGEEAADALQMVEAPYWKECIKQGEDILNALTSIRRKDK